MKKLGEIIGPEVLIMREHVGTATAKDGTVFEMSQNLDRSPLIENKKSGKKYALSWAEIIDLAIENGICAED